MGGLRMMSMVSRGLFGGVVAPFALLLTPSPLSSPGFREDHVP